MSGLRSKADPLEVGFGSKLLFSEMVLCHVSVVPPQFIFEVFAFQF